jgi:hypothetical protein
VSDLYRENYKLLKKEIKKSTEVGERSPVLMDW